MRLFWGAFKTPTLRDVVRTRPYVHDGGVGTLEAVIDYYDRGGNANLNLDSEIHPLRLTLEQKHELAAFLKAISGDIVK